MTSSRISRLTSRKKEIACLVAKGYSNAEIMEELCIALDTVKRHLTIIFKALGIESRVQLAIYAFRHGLVDLEDIEDTEFLVKSPRLSEKQRALVCLISQGYSNTVIAEKLCITSNTVKCNITKISEILCVENRVQIAIWAFKERLVDLEIEVSKRNNGDKVSLQGPVEQFQGGEDDVEPLGSAKLSEYQGEVDMIEPCYALIGAAIRALRRSRGLSQQQLANHLGYERFSSISDLEHGRVRLHVHHLLQLAEFFDVSVTSLLFGACEEMAGKSEVVEDVAWREW